MIPPHERRMLEAHVRGCRLGQLELQQQERGLNEYEERQIKELVRARVQGMPLQYLIGSQAFYGRDFYVNTCVLIPRPETEGLVELALEQLPKRSVVENIAGANTLANAAGSPARQFALEFGTGSGCIALTLAMERKDLFVFASDCSPDALQVAKENARNHRVAAVDFLHVSEEPLLWQYETVPQLELLISNPPYLVASDAVADDVRTHEPPGALFVAEDDPMYFYRFLAELAAEKLAPHGVGVFEIAEQRGLETAAVFEAKGFGVEVCRDLGGRDRYLVVRRKSGELGGG